MTHRSFSTSSESSARQTVGFGRVNWTVDSEDAIKALIQRLDPLSEIHADIIDRATDLAIDWIEFGPPGEDESSRDPYTEHWYCDVPGTPLIAKFLKRE